MRRRFPLENALEFRCYTVIPLANQKLNFDDRISCFTRHDDFSPRSHRAVSLQVAPFLRDCKGRGYRRRAGLSLSLSYGLFRSMANNWHQYCKRIFRTHRLSHSTTMLPSNSIKYLLLYLSRCSAVITMTLLLLLLLVSWGQRRIDGTWDGFSET